MYVPALGTRNAPARLRARRRGGLPLLGCCARRQARRGAARRTSRRHALRSLLVLATPLLIGGRESDAADNDAEEEEEEKAAEAAVAAVSAQCPRAYLDACANTGRFFYRGVQRAEVAAPTYFTKQSRMKPDMLDPATYGAAGAAYFAGLERRLQRMGSVSRPSNSHIVSSSATEARKWGIAASAWPVPRTRRLHYAWIDADDVDDASPMLLYNDAGHGGRARQDEPHLVIDRGLERALMHAPGGCEVMLCADSLIVVHARLDAALRRSLGAR